MRIRRYDVRLMLSEELPSIIHLDALYQNMGPSGQRFKGKVSVGSLNLSVGVLLACDQPLALELFFNLDENGKRFFSGGVQGQMTLECQRCLNPLTFELRTEFCLSPVHGEQDHKQLPQAYEPWVCERQLYVQDLVREEILLNLPTVPMHTGDECHSYSDFVGKQKFFEDPQTSHEENTSSPFAVLKSLR